MNCPLCQRVFEKQKEVEMHIKYFHNKKQQKESSGLQACPECGGVLTFQEGCAMCQSCFYTKCA